MLSTLESPRYVHSTLLRMSRIAWVACVGCDGEPTNDGSTPETLKASKDKVMESIKD